MVATFVSAVDWVGLDAYPGTWGPATAGSTAVATARAMATALATLRDRYLALAGIPSRVALHISENGYSTGTGRTEKMQVEAMRAAIGAVEPTDRVTTSPTTAGSICATPTRRAAASRISIV